MSANPFRFAPDETLETREILPHARLNLFWRGQNRDLEIALVDGFFRFREAGNDSNEWNFALEKRVQVSRRAVVNPGFVKATFPEDLRFGRAGRLFCDDPSGAQWIFLVPEVGYVLSPIPCHEDYRTPFNFDASDFWEKPASFWRAQIENWKQSDSDFAFSRWWHCTSHEEKSRFLARLQQGDFAELEWVAQRIGALDTELLSASKAAHDMNFCQYQIELSRESAETSVFDFWEHLGIEENYARRQKAIWQVALNYFEPHLDPQILNSRGAFREELMQYFSLSFCIETAPPSAHQQLEIWLELRDWMRGKIPETEIQTLLSGS